MQGALPARCSQPGWPFLGESSPPFPLPLGGRLGEGRVRLGSFLFPLQRYDIISIRAIVFGAVDAFRGVQIAVNASRAACGG